MSKVRLFKIWSYGIILAVGFREWDSRGQEAKSLLSSAVLSCGPVNAAPPKPCQNLDAVKSQYLVEVNQAATAAPGVATATDTTTSNGLAAGLNAAKGAIQNGGGGQQMQSAGQTTGSGIAAGTTATDAAKAFVLKYNASMKDIVTDALAAISKDSNTCAQNMAKYNPTKCDNCNGTAQDPSYCPSKGGSSCTNPDQHGTNGGQNPNASTRQACIDGCTQEQSAIDTAAAACATGMQTAASGLGMNAAMLAAMAAQSAASMQNSGKSQNSGNGSGSGDNTPPTTAANPAGGADGSGGSDGSSGALPVASTPSNLPTDALATALPNAANNSLNPNDTSTLTTTTPAPSTDLLASNLPIAADASATPTSPTGTGTTGTSPQGLSGHAADELGAGGSGSGAASGGSLNNAAIADSSGGGSSFGGGGGGGAAGGGDDTNNQALVGIDNIRGNGDVVAALDKNGHDVHILAMVDVGHGIATDGNPIPNGRFYALGRPELIKNLATASATGKVGAPATAPTAANAPEAKIAKAVAPGPAPASVPAAPAPAKQ